PWLLAGTGRRPEGRRPAWNPTRPPPLVLVLPEMFPSRRKTPKLLPVCPNVLTPDRIPSFFIPPTLSSLPGRAARNGGSARRLHGACSVPQLTTQDGLTFLPESPHTRRRESLFHAEWVPGIRLSPPPQPTGPTDSDTASSAETSPFGSPLLLRSLTGTLTCQAHGRRRKLLDAGPVPRARSLSTEEASSTDTSPSCPRREREPSWARAATLAPPPLFHLDSMRCQERLTKEVTVPLSAGGRLRLCCEYLQAQGRLRIRLISAEGLYPPHCDPRHVSCCVAVQLQPGKAQRQRSTLVKRSRNPIFNEDFFFEGLPPEGLPGRGLRFKVLNKGAGVRRDAVLGECQAPLQALLPPSGRGLQTVTPGAALMPRT
uniref:C2 calcium dependent domain containing 4D n=1 Tax=Sphenodon punctatus TaxID=8508 RepID=A0A8D0L2L8_SPHPU